MTLSIVVHAVLIGIPIALLTRRALLAPAWTRVPASRVVMTGRAA